MLATFTYVHSYNSSFNQWIKNGQLPFEPYYWQMGVLCLCFSCKIVEYTRYLSKLPDSFTISDTIVPYCYILFNVSAMNVSFLSHALIISINFAN